MGSDDAYLKRLNYLAYTKILPQQNLRGEFESFLHTITGYENIDRLPIPGGVPSGKAAKKADAFFIGRRIIMEYKELYEGRDYARDATILARKAAIDHAIKAAVKTDEEYLLPNFFTAQMTPSATRNMMRSFNKSLGNVERFVSDADKQTRDTKTVFNLPAADGFLVILNSRINSILPHNICNRVDDLMSKADKGYRFNENKAVIIISQAHHKLERDEFVKIRQRLPPINAGLFEIYQSDALCVAAFFQDCSQLIKHFAECLMLAWVRYAQNDAGWRQVGATRFDL